MNSYFVGFAAAPTQRGQTIAIIDFFAIIAEQKARLIIMSQTHLSRPFVCYACIFMRGGSPMGLRAWWASTRTSLPMMGRATLSGGAEGLVSINTTNQLVGRMSANTD